MASAGAGSLDEFASKLETPRTAWVMVPAGEITDRARSKPSLRCSSPVT